MQFGRLKHVAADGNAGAENVLGPCGRMARHNDKQVRKHARHAVKPCAHSVDVLGDRFLKNNETLKVSAWVLRLVKFFSLHFFKRD